MTPPAANDKPASLGAILHENRVAGRPLSWTRRGLELPPALERRLGALLERLETETGGPVVLTVLSNAEPDLNPFAGIAGVPEPGGERAERLVTLLGPGRCHEWNRWPGHAALLSPAALDCLARPGVDARNAVAALRAAGGRLLLSDSLFLHDSRRPLLHRDALDPHEQRRPTAWAELTQRLDGWLRTQPAADEAADLARYADGGCPVTLHVTHSWGGGVAQWIETFTDGDTGNVNLQLRAEGPQTGQGCGQRYALYLSNRLDAPLASWWLQPPIRSTDDSDPAYRELLAEVIERHGVGRVVVSSLVGHSLDALRTGLPTVQVLHDYYPAWPLLGVHPGPWLRDGQPADLAGALESHRLLPELADLDAADWRSLAARWHAATAAGDVALVAPSRSVVDLLRRIDPAWADRPIEVVPHGLEELPGTAAVEPRERDDGKLRLVIPGRIHDGKGRQLLLDALPELTRYAHVYLVGADRPGHAFFGKAGVDVILQFERAGLRDLLARIGPHVAGLLSVVPETFSYTLTEMQQLDLPVIATRVGSLAERIADGRTGWLIEPDPAALVAKVRELHADRAAIAAARASVAASDLPTVGQMVERYAALCPPRAGARRIDRIAGLREAQTSGMAGLFLEAATRARELGARVDELRAEVETRTRWAESSERARQEEEQRRIHWVADLEQQLERAGAEIERARVDHEAELQRNQAVYEADRQRMHENHEAELQSARAAYEAVIEDYRQTVTQLEAIRRGLQAEHDRVLASTSWRLTRPLRFARRVAGNALRAQAWNPLRWPTLSAQVIRTVRTRGLRGALLRAQLDRSQPPPAPIDIEPIETAAEAPETLPRAARPRASIVIPVYNKWEYTAACLRSLAETPGAAGFEVIVVDDGSTDGSFERLQGIEGLTALRNDENLGFIGSCNRGAEHARGDFLVLLNNDTQVLEGWLDALLGTFERFPDTGLAGARLLYPDGRLQEAGGIIFSDGSGWNYGRLDDPNRPEYQYTREADYCSGACIALRTELFRELGGFDTHYAPAYYEDTDLAFRIRQRGLKVRVQAEASIVHHEGITSGTDLGSGTKRFQAVNRDKFLERWRDALQRQPAPIVDPEDRAEIRRARDHGLKGRILVIDAYTPEPDQDAGSVRLVYLMDCMRELGYGVTFMPDNRAYAGRYTRELQRVGVEVVHDPWIESLPRFLGERGAEFDFVLVCRHYIASKYIPLVRKHCPRARFIFDTVDLHFLREERQAELEDSSALRRAAAQTRRAELAVIGDADVTLVVSPVEKTLLEQAAPEARVHIVSLIHEVVGSRKPWAERKDLFFVGGYQHPPNVDAAQWFVREIWPRVHAELPGVEFHLIGSKATDAVRALDGNGVRFHGFVESLEPWLDNCRLAVAPLRFGAGIKGKVNVSMAHGQPVVATPIAVEGMFAKPGRDVLVAETAADFAAQVVRLYRDEALWNVVSASGLENIRRYFSLDTARLGLQKLLTSL
jgi:GT2 family glycosyltransferase